MLFLHTVYIQHSAPIINASYANLNKLLSLPVVEVKFNLHNIFAGYQSFSMFTGLWIIICVEFVSKIYHHHLPWCLRVMRLFLLDIEFLSDLLLPCIIPVTSWTCIHIMSLRRQQLKESGRGGLGQLGKPLLIFSFVLHLVSVLVGDLGLMC